MQSFSLVHLAEERCLVSYRYWKTFTGPYGVPAVPKAYRMFVRNLDQNPKLVLQRIDDVLSDHGLIHSAKVGASMVKLFRLSDFLALSLERLTLDPQWLIETKA